MEPSTVVGAKAAARVPRSLGRLAPGLQYPSPHDFAREPTPLRGGGLFAAPARSRYGCCGRTRRSHRAGQSRASGAPAGLCARPGGGAGCGCAMGGTLVVTGPGRPAAHFGRLRGAWRQDRPFAGTGRCPGLGYRQRCPSPGKNPCQFAALGPACPGAPGRCRKAASLVGWCAV